MTNHPRIFALIVAAGSGSRLGGELPKQYQHIGGHGLLRHSASALITHPRIAGVLVAIHPDHRPHYDAATHGLDLLPPIAGGVARSDSVAAGLAALAPHQPDYVLVHDAARPFLSHAMIDALIEALSTEHGVVPAIEVVDTVRRLGATTWEEVDRTGLMRIQTPQAFPYAALRAIAETGLSATDEAALWLAAGRPLRYVPGDERLRKVTNADDKIWAEQQLQVPRRTAIGIGYDVHALVPSGERGIIRIGGIDIENAHALHGHSDADVVLHAVVDALLGTVAEGDIGSHFSPADERWRGADSRVFVEEARARVAAHGGVIQHLDITIIGERPKIAPHRDAMRAAIAGMLKLPLAQVSVKATTTEKLGFTGREEGIAAQAIATVQLPGVA